jgi:hypothetical protein
MRSVFSSLAPSRPIFDGYMSKIVALIIKATESIDTNFKTSETTLPDFCFDRMGSLLYKGISYTERYLERRESSF